jgi:hypothetical protein
MLGSRSEAVKREKQPDGRNARGAGCGHVVEPVGGDAANRQNRRSRRSNNRSQAFDAEYRSTGRFRLRRKHRAGNQIVAAFGGGGLAGGVNRPSNQKPAANNAARVGRRNRVSAQMDTVGAARQRHVQPIVDDDSRRCAAGERQSRLDERGELAAFEIALSYLNQIDAALDGVLELGQQEATGVIERGAGSGQPPSIRHETPDHSGVPRSRIVRSLELRPSV